MRFGSTGMDSVLSHPARLVWQGSAGDCRPYADLVGNPEVTFGGFSHQLARTVLEEVVAPTGLPLMKRILSVVLTCEDVQEHQNRRREHCR